ncbi:MAG TPA: hypothetical protein VIH60_08530 [Steroidobacteraceae bacterium]
MSRLAQLEARRLVLLARCEAQRAELGERAAELTALPRRWLKGGLLGGSAAGAGVRPTNHPLAWIAALAGAMLLGRTREVLTFMVWARTALSMVSRVTQVLALVGAVRKMRPRSRERAQAAP